MIGRGRFISFEGGEGAGKSTQARALAHRLMDCGLPVLLTREPGGTAGAEAVRDVLLSGAARRYGMEGEALLFAAARADHVDRLIRPALAEGVWVISDRFVDSTRAYQGGTGVGDGLVDELERIAVDGVMPDLTFLLDIPPRIGLARAARRGPGAGAADRFEGDKLPVHRRRRQAFLAIASREPERCVVVRALAPSSALAERIWRATVERLQPLAAVADRSACRMRGAA